MARRLHHLELRQASTQCTLFSLRKASRTVTQVYDAALAPVGLKGTQFTVLVAIAVMENPAIAQLAETLVMDRTTLSRNLAPLRRAALIRIEAGADRRSRIVQLSPRGHDRLAAAYPLWRRAQAQVVGALGRPRWHGLLDHLAGVVALAREGRPSKRTRAHGVGGRSPADEPQ